MKAGAPLPARAAAEPHCGKTRASARSTAKGRNHRSDGLTPQEIREATLYLKGVPRRVTPVPTTKSMRSIMFFVLFVVEKALRGAGYSARGCASGWKYTLAGPVSASFQAM